MLNDLRNSMTLQAIGDKHGVHQVTALRQIRKLNGYDQLLENALQTRYKAAREANSITSTRDSRRRVKLTWAILWRERPIVAKAMQEKSRPKACSKCQASDISLRMLANMWRWSCGRCGERGTSFPEA